MSYFDDNPEYPYRVRYISDDKIGYLEEYSQETGYTKSGERFTGPCVFRIKDLIYNNILESSSTNVVEGGEPGVRIKESCRGEVQFGYYKKGGRLPTLSYFGTDKEIEKITIKIEESEKGDVGFNSFVMPEMYGGHLSLYLRLEKTFFQTMKELVLAEKLEEVILEVNVFIFPGYYRHGFWEVKLLAEDDMVDNKDEMHEMIVSHDSIGFDERWSKDFKLRLSHHTKTLPFVDEEYSE